MKKTTGLIVLAAISALIFFGCAEDTIGPVTTTTTTTTTTSSTTSTTVIITGNTYYVSTAGNDGNAGTLSAPWKTVQHAADVMQAGDGTYIRGGKYNERVYTTRSGTSGNYIFFLAYPGEIPTIEGAGVTSSTNGIFVSHDYICLSGLHIYSWEGNAVWAEGAGYLLINSCDAYGVTYGFGFSDGTHDFVLNNCVAHDYLLYGFDASPSGGADCYNGTFNDCVAHTGSDPAQNVDGFALGHGTQHNFTFNRCVVYDIYDGFDISARDTTLSRCLARDCWNGGYKLWADNVTLVNCLGYNSTGANLEVDWDGTPGTTTLRNCTFFGGQSFNIWVENASDSLHMYNCLLAGGDNIGLGFEQTGVASYEGDYNLFHNGNPDRAIAVAYTDEFSLSQIAAGDWTTYSGQDSHSVVSTDEAIILVDPANFDFHLKAGSPAIDKGTSVNAPSEDYDGNPRPRGAGYDIGAYEKQ